MKICSSFKIDFGGGGSEILKNFTASAARQLRLFLIGGDGSEIFKIFAISAAAVFFSKKSAATAAQPIGLHL